MLRLMRKNKHKSPKGPRRAAENICESVRTNDVRLQLRPTGLDSSPEASTVVGKAEI